MPLRPATQTDLTPAARICASAFFNDNLFGDHIHPHRHDFPDDMYIYWLKRFCADLGAPDQHFMVSTNSDDRVIGVAHWIRKREKQSEEAVLPVEKESEAVGRLPANRAADPEREDVVERCYPFLGHVWEGKRAESWYLACLAVDPESHGKGSGRELVAWGFQQAEQEGVCVSVIAARGKDQFYQRCGFTSAAGHAGDGKGNPLRDVEGGAIYFKDVES